MDVKSISTCAVLFVAGVFVAPAVAWSAPETGCATESFSVTDVAAPLVVTVCPATKTAAAGAPIDVTETISSGAKSFTRAAQIDVFAGDKTSRSIDDVPLDRVGLAKTLHLTIGYRTGVVRIEHALLVPGAIPLK